jgi:intein-encoded DNA endonuclease-like protein
MQKYHYNDQEKQEIERLYNEGHGAPYIAKFLQLAQSGISYYIKKHISNKRDRRAAARKFKCNDHFFDVIDTEEKAYWLGFMYADGYVSSSKYSKAVGLSISEQDESHLIKFKHALEAEHPIHKYYTTGYSNRTIYVKLLITSPILFNGAVKQGIIEHKTNILQAPNIPQKLQHHFIRGYFDGDGCLAETNTETRHEFALKILGTQAVLDYIKEYLELHHIAKINHYYKRKTQQIVSSLELSGHYQIIQFLDLLYKDATVFLERKHDKFIKLCTMVYSRVTSKRCSLKSPQLLEILKAHLATAQLETTNANAAKAEKKDEITHAEIKAA